MFATKSTLAAVAAAFLAAVSAHAELKYRSTVFEPLQPVYGKTGKTVTVSAKVYIRVYNTDTRSNELIPIPKATVTFDGYRKVNTRGTGLMDYGPIGKPVVTDANGACRTSYRLPAGAKKKLQGYYRATFAGGLFNGIVLRPLTSPRGEVIVVP